MAVCTHRKGKDKNIKGRLAVREVCLFKNPGAIPQALAADDDLGLTGFDPFVNG